MTKKEKKTQQGKRTVRISAEIRPVFQLNEDLEIPEDIARKGADAIESWLHAELDSCLRVGGQNVCADLDDFEVVLATAEIVSAASAPVTPDALKDTGGICPIPKQ